MAKGGKPGRRTNNSWEPDELYELSVVKRWKPRDIAAHFGVTHQTIWSRKQTDRYKQCVARRLFERLEPNLEIVADSVALVLKHYRAVITDPAAENKDKNVAARELLAYCEREIERRRPDRSETEQADTSVEDRELVESIDEKIAKAYLRLESERVN